MELMTRREFMQTGATTAAAAAVAPLRTSSQDGKGKGFPFAVVFELHTTPETHQAYLGTAQRLRPMLDEIPGFISIERSASLMDENALLSLSYWADEAALSLARIESPLERENFGQWLSSMSKTVPQIQGYHSLSSNGRYYLCLPSGAFAEAREQAVIVHDSWTKLNIPSSLSIRMIEVERDYGMEVRDQAPQFFRTSGRATGGSHS